MNSLNEPGDNDWPASAADTIERVVTTIRNYTTDPLERFTRVIVYGLAAALLGVAVLTLTGITIVRFLDIWIPGSVWGAHLVTGGIFSAFGLFCWRKRFVPHQDQ